MTSPRRSLSATALIVIAVVIAVAVIGGAVAYVALYRPSAASAPSPSYPGLVPPSTVGSYLGGSWTLDRSGSGMAYIEINWSTGTVSARLELLNGSSFFYSSSNLSRLTELKSLYLAGNVTLVNLTEIGSYLYVGNESSQVYGLQVVVFDFNSPAAASELYNYLYSSANVGAPGVWQARIDGAQAIIALSSSADAAVALKGNYFVAMITNYTGASASSWEGLVTSVLISTP